MPFTFQLKHWAAQRPHHPAVIAGAQSLGFARLLAAATNHEGVADHARAGEPGIAVIDEPTGTELAIQFCAAALAGRTAMVLDAGWPAPLRRRLRGLAQAWDDSRDPDTQPFLLGLSSGTSGTPKAFLRSAASWQESFRASASYFSVTEASRTLAPGPMAASMNLYALGESLFAGGTFIAIPQFSPDAALAAMAEHGVNRLVLVPAVLELMARRGLAAGMDGSGLRHIVCAGSALSTEAVELARAWAPHAVIQQYYGAAELGFVTAAQVDPDNQVDPGARDDAGEDSVGVTNADMQDAGVGGAFPGVQLSIRDGSGAELPAGEVGLVAVKSPYLCDGYAWGDDGLAFTDLGTSGWHTVHDRGSMGTDGILHLAGRASDMILTSGSNVYPHAVEQALQHDLDGCIVLVTGIPDPLRGQRVVAAFHRNHADHPAGAPSATATSATADSGAAGSAAAVMEVLRRTAATLPTAHKPTQYFELAQLPRTGSGKTSRALLAAWISEGDPRVRRQS